MLSHLPGFDWESTSSPRRAGSALAANEFLAALREDAERAHSNRFTSDQAAEWMSRRGYSRTYTQKMLFRLKKRQLLSASRSPRLLLAGFFRGVLNIYEITKRGIDRADWWLRRHSIFGFKALSCIGQRNELARSMVADALPSLAPSLGPFTLRFSDRKGLGWLLSNLSGNLSFSISFPGFDGAVWWIERLKAEGTVPRHLAKFPFASLAKTHGFSDEQILISVLYKSNRYWKECFQRLQKEIDEEREAQSTRKELIALLIKIVFALQEQRFEKLLEEERATNRKLAETNGIIDRNIALSLIAYACRM